MIRHPELGRVVQEPENCLKISMTGALEVIEEAGVSAESVLAVGFTGQMGGVIGIDSDYNLCTGFDSPLDNRCFSYTDYLIKNFNDELFRYTSGSPTHAAKILYWKNEHPDIYARINKFVPLASYVCGKWCGHCGDDAFYDYTNLSFTGLNNVCTLDWNTELCRMFGIDLAKLPRIVKPWEIVGKVTAECAGICGVKQGTPVIAGAGDQPAGFLGAGIITPETAIDVSGGTSVFSICTDHFIPDMERNQIVYMNSVFPGLFYPLSYVSGGGQNVRWFRDNFAKEELGESAKNNESVFSILEKNAAELDPGIGGLLFIPYLAGQACPNVPEFNGAWVGLTWGHTRMHMYRAVLEAVVYDHKLALTHLSEMFPNQKISSIRATGGGSKNKLWNRIKADVMGLPICTLDTCEVGLRGTALLAAYGIGCISDLKKASAEGSRVKEKIEPSKENAKVYQYMTESYRDCVDCLTSHFKKI
jgi:xylulokinase